MEERTAQPTSTTDYSASQAPETQEAVRNTPEHDLRAIPGGDPARATIPVGMEALDRGENVSTNLGQTSSSELRDTQAPERRRGRQ